MTRLLALHGFTGVPSDFADLLAGLDLEDADVDAPALTGHGPAPRQAPTFDAELERLATELDLARAPARHGLGYSMGARVLLGLALRQPKAFHSLTLIGANPGLESEPERNERQAWEKLLCQRIEADGLEAFVDYWQALPIFASQSKVRPGRLAAQRRGRLTHSASGLVQAIRALGLGQMPSLWQALATLDQPILLVVGEQDLKFRALAERMLDSLPRARLAIAPGAGHNVLLEAPELLQSEIGKTWTQ